MAFLSWRLAEESVSLNLVEKERDFYKQRIDSYYRDWQDIEFGMWEKLKVNGYYVFLGINDVYETNFLIPNDLKKVDVIGKSNVDVFGKYVGGAWRKNDSIVAYGGKVVTTVEPVRYGKEFNYVFISKWRKIRRNGDTVVIGMAIKMDTIFNKLFKAQEISIENKDNDETL